MGEIDAGLRDHRDENKPLTTTGASKYRLPLNSSVSSSSCLDSNSSSSSSSKSNSPDHVVPREKGLASPHHHRLSTSSGSSSPQTDGSISCRRHLGGPDVSSRSSSSGRGVADESASATAAGKEGRNSAGRRATSGQPRLHKALPKRRTAPRKSTMPSDGSSSSLFKQEHGEGGNKSEADYVIRCICGYKDILGEQIQCEKCEVWQHFGCMGIQLAAVPDCYLCEVCDPTVHRPLRAEEARDLHMTLLAADQLSVEERSRRKAKRITQRKPSDAVSAHLPPRQTDLMASDKKKTDTASVGGSNGGGGGGGSGSGSSAAALAKPGGENGVIRQTNTQKDDLSELSRDDRKILQYEQMFKRMEERRDKKGRRKRHTEGSSNGSPSRELGARDREEESHEDSTNPPPSPPNMAAVSVVEPPVVVTETFIVPTDETFTVPTTKESLPAKMRKVRRTKEEKAKARKDSSASESETAMAEKAEKKKARYSMRLRNFASAKVATQDITPEDSRIELNCVKKSKKRDEAEGCQEEELNISSVTLPVKRRLRTTSFVDNFYSAMAELQTETETQKATRRNRAYSASQEWEKVKVEQERSRLYHLYGLKKAVCARFNEEPIENLIESASKKSESCHAVFKFAHPEVFAVGRLSAPAAPPKTTKRAPSPDTLIAAAMKRSRTVRAIIEESVRKNCDYENSHQVGSQRMAAAYPSFKRQDAAAPTRPPITAAEIISAATALRSDIFGKNSLSNDSVKNAKQELVTVSGASVAQSMAVATPSAVVTTLATDEAAQMKSERDVEASPVTTPKKLSLAEYKQRKLNSQVSSDSLTGSVFSSPPISPVKPAASPSFSPVKSAVDASSPTQTIPVVMSPTRSNSSPLAPPVAPPSRMTSVIHRIGTVNNNLIPMNPAEKNSYRPATGARDVVTNHIPRLQGPSPLAGHHPLGTAAFVQNFRPSASIARTHVVEDLKT